MRFDFICGCGHSGTTLLLKIISQVDEIYTPNAETNMMGAPQGVEHFIDKLAEFFGKASRCFPRVVKSAF